MNMRLTARFLILVPLFLVGCFQGMPKEKPPIHLVTNMDVQDKYKPQRESRFFEDGSAMRPLVEGTVARGDLREDDVYYRGRTAAGDLVATAPVKFTEDVLLRGQDRYQIFCTPCHGQVGDGQGIIMKYKYPIPPTSFQEQRILDAPDGHLYEVISNGIRNMPSYKEQIPVDDRWAIVGYVRALQRSQNAGPEDVPDSVRVNR